MKERANHPAACFLRTVRGAIGAGRPTVGLATDARQGRRQPGAARNWLAIGMACLLVSLSGCPSREAGSPPGSSAKPFEGIKLRLAVVEDPAMAQAIGRLRGEWTAQTGSEFDVVPLTQKELETATSMPVDVVIGPAYLFGVLAEQNLLAPLSKERLASPEWTDLFDLLKLREVAWGSESNKNIQAVPFGSPLFVCYYRADLLAKMNRRPPQNWREYQELAKLFASQKPSQDKPWAGTIEPLAPGWAGLVLLARAAPYAKHRDDYSTLFKIDTMEPLLNTPAFVQALEELVAAAKLGPTDPLAFDPSSARAAFWKGQCAMTLAWPSAAESATSQSEAQPAGGSPKSDAAIPREVDAAIQVGFVELPGSDRVYNRTTKTWQTRTEDEDPRVPLLDASGRLGMVSRQASHVEAGFQLLFWLADKDRSSTVSAASPATTLFSRSQLAAADRWVEKPAGAAAAAQYATVMESALCREAWLSAIPIPGRARYLAALDEAVRLAVRGEKTPTEALTQTEAQWREITKELGLDRQKAAYRHSFGW